MPPRRAPSPNNTAEEPLFLDASSSSDAEFSEPELPPMPQSPLPPSPPPKEQPPPQPDSTPVKPKPALSTPTKPPIDDDPVIQTFNVTLHPSLAPHLQLFQYPVRAAGKPYTTAASCGPLEARWKPKSGLVEVDVPVNVRANYDKEKGRVWGDVLRKAVAEKEKRSGGGGGRGVGGGGDGAGGKRRKVASESDEEEEEDETIFVDFEEAVSKGRVLDRQTLGSRMQSEGGRYMVAVFKGDNLHFTPLSTTLQLRPQFPHVDSALDQERAATKALRDAAAPQKTPEARAVHLSVKSTDDPSSQTSSTMKALRIAEEEEWVKCHWVDQDADDAWEVYEGLKGGAVVEKDEAKEGTGKLRLRADMEEYLEGVRGGIMGLGLGGTAKKT
ncbi:hypothetical protein RUND412_008545 [Rhizina undulata]